MKNNLSFWPLGLLLLGLASCSPRESTTPPVVTSFSVLGDLASRLISPEVPVHALVGPEADPHTYEPTPQDRVLLEQAPAILTVGLEFEPWLEDLVPASRLSPVTGTVNLIRITENDEHHEDDGHDADDHPTEEDHHHGEFDPHFWESPRETIRAVEEMSRILGQTFPALKSTIETRTQQLLKDLQNLDQEMTAAYLAVPVENRVLITTHGAYAYLARDYGLQSPGNALGSVSTEGGDPSASHLAGLSQEIRRLKVKALFAESTHNTKVLQALSEETGVSVVTGLISGALGKPGSGAEDYFSLMRHNTQIITNSLK